MAVQEHPAARILRRRPNTITTDRHFAGGGAGAHFAAGRARRVLKGDVLMRRCVVCFLLALTGVLKTPQYSIAYYACWLGAYMSFFLILPCVLPTDTARIRVMLVVTVFNMTCGSVLGLRFALRKATSCVLRPLVCRCDVSYWIVHAGCAAVVAVANALCLQLAPGRALDRFWRHCGVYFNVTGLASFLSFLVVYFVGDKYQQPQFRVAKYGNLALIALQFVIARLCLSPWFKNWMWRYAASVAVTAQRPPRPRTLCWLVPSTLLLFALALLRFRGPG